MKSDLDRLMAARNLDGFIVVSDESYNAVRDYLTNGARVTGGYVLKKRGEPAHMIVNGMEIEEAKASGLTVHDRNNLGYYDLIKELKDPTQIKVRWWEMMFKSVGLESGRIGVYGAGDLNVYLEVFRMMDQHLDGYELVGETGKTLFDEAMVTKDEAEIARIASVAERTSEVIAMTWDYIAGHQADGVAVVDADSEPLTIGAVKGFIRRSLIERSLEDTGMIFAQGRDGGFPHSRGQDDQPLQTGQAIVFDLFPRELGGGYHHDMTRTWCIDHAPEIVQTAYDQVMEAFDRSIELTKVGMTGNVPQEAVLDYFEELGHPTARTDARAGKGYVHSLGHGVGLNIHERPRLSHLFKDDIQPGMVITVEPGLYYPDEGYGIRIEDMVVVQADGTLRTLTNFHKQLVIPLKG